MTAFYIGEYLRDFLSYKSSIESVRNTNHKFFQFINFFRFYKNFDRIIRHLKLFCFDRFQTHLIAQQDFFATSAPFPNIYVCSDSLHSVSKSNL